MANTPDCRNILLKFQNPKNKFQISDTVFFVFWNFKRYSENQENVAQNFIYIFKDSHIIIYDVVLLR